VEDSCEHGKELPGSKKVGNFLTECLLASKKGSVPQSWLVLIMLYYVKYYFSKVAFNHMLQPAEL
jgi:hypothetical protein